MAVNTKDMKCEKEHLDEIKEWINNETKNILQNHNTLKERVAALKKEAKGKYSEELENYKRMYERTEKALENYKSSKDNPYFARIDFKEDRRECESFYIGKVGLGNIEEGEEKVIDWRAPIADLYYSGTFGECYYLAPSGIINGKLLLKRKFLIRDGALKDVFDEGINEIILKAQNEDHSLIDEFLRINLEESVSGKLKEVVATIQKEQNDIIRAEKNSAIFIQGSAGSGKTTVALHRLAFLLYKYSEKLNPSDILVIAPNKLFLDYIGDVLPELGVNGVVQKTFEELSKEVLGVKGKVLTKEEKLSLVLENDQNEKNKFITNTSKLKGSMTFKKIMDRYLTIIANNDADIEDMMVSGYVLFNRKDIRRLFLKDMINLPINSRKVEIKKYYKNKLSQRIEEIKVKVDSDYDDKIKNIKNIMEDGPCRRKKLIEIYDERDKKKKEISDSSLKEFNNFFNKWIVNDTKSLYYDAFSNRELFDEITGGIIPPKLADYIIDDINFNRENDIIDEDDLIPMLYLKFKIEGTPLKYLFSHIVIDEAQDYSFFNFEVVKLLSSSGSYTIVGDVSQGIYSYRGVESLNKVLKDVFNSEGKYVPLTLSYRSTVEIIEFANKILRKQKGYNEPAKPVLRHGEKPSIIKFDTYIEFVRKVDEIYDKMTSLKRNSIAIIGKTYEECVKIKEIMKKHSKNSWSLIKDKEKVLKTNSIIIPSYMTKGIEFDCTIIFNADDISYREIENDKKLLYVVLTRALHNEYVFYKGKPSLLISDCLS